MKISDTPYSKQPLISPTPLFLREKPEPPTPRLFLVKFGVEMNYRFVAKVLL